MFAFQWECRQAALVRLTAATSQIIDAGPRLPIALCVSKCSAVLTRMHSAVAKDVQK